MLCEEFKAMFRNDPLTSTNGEVDAMVRHFMECPACAQELREKADAALADLGAQYGEDVVAEAIASFDDAIDAKVDAYLSDPETVLGNKCQSHSNKRL